MTDTLTEPAETSHDDPEPPREISPIDRANQCRMAIDRILRDYGCRIRPMIAGEGVGVDPGAKLLLTATYHVVPEES